MNTTLPTRPKLDERLQVAVSADEKRKLFEVATKRRTTVSEMLRRALDIVVTQQPA